MLHNQAKSPQNMDLRICLTVMCGIPGSGKSSFCRWLNHELWNRFFIINVNYDKILLASDSDEVKLHHILSENQEREGGSIVKAARQQVLNLVGVIIQNILNHGPLVELGSLDGLDDINEDVKKSFLGSWLENSSCKPEGCKEVLLLIDDNMNLSSMRYEYYKLARHYGTSFCEIFMDCPIEKAVLRNGMREGREVLRQEVIEKMYQRMEPPDPLKNHWEKYSVKLNTEEKFDGVLSMLQEAYQNPVQPLNQTDEEEQAKSQFICSKNHIHQADIILRKCVAKTIANGKKTSSDVRLLSQQLMEVKEDILSSMKGGDLRMNCSENSAIDASKDENCDFYKYVFGLFFKKLKKFE